MEADRERDRELAELLEEVRALRETLDELKRDPWRLPPDYAVLARTGGDVLPPDYAVAVRTRPTLPPDYAVLVRQARPSYAVLARSDLPPTYEVLVRPAGPDDVEGPMPEQ
jgi:hypothetical protein